MKEKIILTLFVVFLVTILAGVFVAISEPSHIAIVNEKVLINDDTYFKLNNNYTISVNTYKFIHTEVGDYVIYYNHNILGHNQGIFELGMYISLTGFAGTISCLFLGMFFIVSVNAFNNEKEIKNDKI